MKKNLKIGMGLAMVSLVSMAAVIPVFADVKPSNIEKTGTVIAVNAESNVSLNAADEAVKEETGKQTAAGTDHSKSPNLCKVYYDDKTMEEKEPEAKPSDYEDKTIRKLAEAYVQKGYFLSDAKFAATHYGSGFGFEDEYVFCNGFSAVDDNKGNNKVYIQVVKATPEEFAEYTNGLTETNGSVKKSGTAVFSMKDDFKTEEIRYDEKNQVMIIDIRFNPSMADRMVG